MLYALKIATQPSDELFTLLEAKDFLKFSGTDQDDVIYWAIRAAREHIENFTGRALVTQTWDMYFDGFPSAISIPRPPLISVTHLKYVNTDGTLTALASTEYTTDIRREPGRIFPAYSKSWPSIRDSEPNAVEIRFVAGYGTPDAVPEAIRQAAKMLLAHFFVHREDDAKVPDAVDSLLWPHRVLSF